MKAKEKEKKVEYKYNLSVYFKFLFEYKWFLIFALLFSLVVESTPTVYSFLFKKIVDNGTSFTAGSLTSSAFVSVLMGILGVFVVISVARIISDWGFIHFVNRLENGIILSIKRKFFNHLVSLSHGFHTSHKTGSLISRLVRAGGATERMTDVIVFNVMPLVFQLVVVISSLIYFDWISAVVIAGTVVIFIGYSYFLQVIRTKATLEANEAEDREKGFISDVFTNVESIKYFGKENWIRKRFEKISDITQILTLKNWDYHRWTEAGQSVILVIGTFLLIYFPIKQLLAGTISMGTLVFIYSVFLSLMWAMYSFVFGIRNFYRSIADFQDLFQYGKIENDIKDKRDAREIKINNGEIDFKNVWFAYDKRIIFQGLNLKIPAGKKIALVGHSGSGKSTLVKLLYRLYDVNSGSIEIDNVNINDVKQESLREGMSIVPQECILFDDTIYNNVAFSNPGATRNEVLRALRFAQLDKIIKSFPDKENTIVGERGIKLSGGEKQRVSIARAILANKKILVLDEATSSLDSKTEYDIQLALKKLMEGRTTIIIAHRLSTIMNADVIVVMEKGCIKQIGTHGKLIKQEGVYKKLWDLQKGGYIR